MKMFISPKNARKAALKALRGRVRAFRLEPRVQLNRDGTADHGIAVSLWDDAGNIVGWLR